MADRVGIAIAAGFGFFVVGLAATGGGRRLGEGFDGYRDGRLCMFVGVGRGCVDHPSTTGARS